MAAQHGKTGQDHVPRTGVPEQVVEQAFAPQHREHGLGDERAILLAEFFMCAKITRHHAVGRILKAHYRGKRLGGVINQVGGQFHILAFIRVARFWIGNANPGRPCAERTRCG